ncbi:hypothetical protein BH10BAC3_BH10BAC3_17520 [soil metagenome]
MLALIKKAGFLIVLILVLITTYGNLILLPTEIVPSPWKIIF